MPEKTSINPSLHTSHDAIDFVALGFEIERIFESYVGANKLDSKVCESLKLKLADAYTENLIGSFLANSFTITSKKSEKTSPFDIGLPKTWADLNKKFSQPYIKEQILKFKEPDDAAISTQHLEGIAEAVAKGVEDFIAQRTQSEGFAAKVKRNRVHSKSSAITPAAPNTLG